MRNVRPYEPISKIHAVSTWDSSDPMRPHWSAEEDRGQKRRNTPGENKAEEAIYDPCEGLVDAEDAEVEAENRGLDEGNDKSVDDFVREGIYLECSYRGYWV